MSTLKDQRAFQAYILLSLAPLLMYKQPDFASELLKSYELTSMLSGFPYLAFIMIGFLGRRLNQTRILFTSILFFLSYYFISAASQSALAITPIDNDSLRQIFAIALPLSLCIYTTFKESRLLNYRSLIKLMIALLPFLFLMFSYSKEPEVFTQIVTYTPVVKPLSLGVYLPEVAFFAYIAYFFHLLFSERY